MNTLRLTRTPIGGQVRIGLALEEVLKRVPGKTVKARAATIGVTRQTYYGWLAGRTRPDIRQARRLASLTGLEASKIRGWTVLSADGDDD